KAVTARLAFSEKSPNSSMNRGALAESYASLAKALGPIDRDDSLKQYDNAIGLLEPLTVIDRSNVQSRIVLADALSNTARTYAAMAPHDGEPSARIRDGTKARSLYRRSQELWLELDRTGKIPPTRHGAIPEVTAELARCNVSMAKLQALQ